MYDTAVATFQKFYMQFLGKFQEKKRVCKFFFLWQEISKISHFSTKYISIFLAEFVISIAS